MVFIGTQQQGLQQSWQPLLQQVFSQQSLQRWPHPHRRRPQPFSLAKNPRERDSQQGTCRHSQCPLSTQRRHTVVTGLQVTQRSITVRSSTVGTQTHSQRVIVRTSQTRFQTVQVRVRISGTHSQRYETQGVQQALQPCVQQSLAEALLATPAAIMLARRALRTCCQTMPSP
jgi:hypothetical protein